MSLSLQESGEVQGFTVDLPSSLFMMVKEREEVVEHRVLVMDINRQNMFQVMPTWMAGWVSHGLQGCHQTRVLLLTGRRCLKMS